MAQTSWPFENADTSEAQFSKWAKSFVDTGVVSGLTLGVAAGMNVTVAAGAAVIEGFYYENSAVETLAVAAANATQARKDYLVLRLDLTANSVALAVKTGTPTSGGGTLPSLAQSSTVWEHPIGVLTVPAAAVNMVSGNLQPLLAGTGASVVPYSDLAARPTPEKAVVLGINLSTRKLDLWVGGSWYALIPDLTWANVSGKPATFAPSAHGHPYTDLTGVPTTFAPSAHGHTWAEVADKPLTFNPTAHGHAWTEITGKPATFAPSTHTHDDRYYTEAEANAKLGGRKYTANASAPSGPATGDLWDELT